VVRRAERAVWKAIEAGVDQSPVCAVYLNRLSDLMFVLARLANVSRGGDVKWIPAANRRQTLSQ
jgi:cob(I)alamin adenosyltransferase